jgi:hypothetical protein
MILIHHYRLPINIPLKPRFSRVCWFQRFCLARFSRFTRVSGVLPGQPGFSRLPGQLGFLQGLPEQPGSKVLRFSRFQGSPKVLKVYQGSLVLMVQSHPGPATGFPENVPQRIVQVVKM